MTTRLPVGLGLFALLHTLCACREDRPADAGTDGGEASPGGSPSAPRDGGAADAEARDAGRRDAVFDDALGCRAGDTTAVDLLFVIDNSSSMREEQQALARELPRMVERLTSGDTDGDGEADTLPVENLHLGVVSTDMGAAGNDGRPEQQGSPSHDLHGCGNPGDDGRLLFPDACEGQSDLGNFLAFSPGNDPVALGERFACVSQLGTEGCGLEQQLDAMLKALTSDEDTRFFAGSTGHGSGANGGFLRDRALLAVVVVTDEDDCSLPDVNAGLMSLGGGLLSSTTLQNVETGESFELDLGVGINVRCGAAPEALHPLERYVEGLRGLKPGHPERVLFAAIAGIPTELEGMSAEAMLAHESMQFEPEPALVDPRAEPRPSCERADPERPFEPQKAFPPRRIVELVGRFGEAGVVQSICRDDFSVAVDAILERVSDAVTCVRLD